MMKKLLWLDDERNPWHDIESRVPKGKYEIHWVKDYNEFTNWILKNGLPHLISFDHDLHDEHYTPSEFWHDYEASAKYQDEQNYTEKTGMNCAWWLIGFCSENKIPLPLTNVHSANPPGADNIRGLLKSYRRHNEPN